MYRESLPPTAWGKWKKENTMEHLVTIGKIVAIKGRRELTHEYRRDRLPEPIPSADVTFPTFLFTLPAVHPASKAYVDLETGLAELGGFTQWEARGAWKDRGKLIWETVRVYLVSTDNESVLRNLFGAALDEFGEQEGYFVKVGQHEIV